MGWSWESVTGHPLSAQDARDIFYIRQTELEFEERMRQRAN